MIALACQYGVMPLLAFLLALVFQVSHIEAVSMVVVGCCPGGSTSNLFAQFSRADVPLSIVSTTISSIMSFGALPLLLLIYTQPFTDDNVAVPYVDVLMTLALVLVAVVIGALVRHCNAKAGTILTKAASGLGGAFIIVAIIVGSVTEAAIFSASWKLYAASIILLPLGAACGYCICHFAGLPPKSCRTISLETGLQNSTLGLTILSFTFSGGQFEEAAVYALLYSLFLVIEGVLLSALFAWLARRAGPALATSRSGVELATSNEKEALDLTSRGINGSASSCDEAGMAEELSAEQVDVLPV